MSTISFDCVEANTYLSNFVERILPSDCICVSLMLDRDTSHLYLIRLERGHEPLLIQLDYDARYNDDFRTMMHENDTSMKQSDRRKFWNSRTDLNRNLKVYLRALETNVFGRYRMLLLGSYGADDEAESWMLADFKRRFGVTLTKDRSLSLKIIMLGCVDHLTRDQIQAELKLNFDSSLVPDIEKWINNIVMPRLAIQKRKHVCLIVDRVNLKPFFHG